MADEPKFYEPNLPEPDLGDPKQWPWLDDAGLRRLWAVLNAAAGEARVVGGAVRDALLGRPVGEIDLAVNQPPEKVMARLEAAGIKAVPTGLDHGTVTAVVDHRGYEITTLRRDVATDGRHATVAYIDDWQEDAERRDFTLNALSVDAEGKLYDYTDGRADLAMGRVRFIGDAHRRLREDVLRALRFFRFYAIFGRGEADRSALEACAAAAGRLPQLSSERVWRELVKLLASDDPVPAWRLMRECGVVAQILPEATDDARLAALVGVEKKYAVAASPLRRLAALLTSEAAVLSLARRLKLANREAEELRLLATTPQALNDKLDPTSFRRLLYAVGETPACDMALLRAANSGEDLTAILATAVAWEKPVLPLQGADLLELGMAAGPAVGALLRQVEAAWIDADFRLTKTQCLEIVRKIMQKP